MTQFLIKRFIPDYQNTEVSSVRTAYGRLAGIVGIICNLLLFAGKFTAGTLFGSVAVTADAFNNLSDASSNIVTLLGFWLGSRPADEEHPFGHARYEYLAGLAVSVTILVIGAQLIRESVEKIIAPTPVEFRWLTVAVLAASILVKLWLALFYNKLGAAIHSDTLAAAGADSRNDALSSAVILVSLFVTRITGIARVDGVMGLMVAAFVIASGANMVKETLSPLLGKTPEPELVEYVEKKIMSYEGVLGIHELMIHDYGPGQRFASVHVEIPAEQNVLVAHDMIDNIEKDFKENDNLLMTIHYDPIVTNDPLVNELRALITEAAWQMDGDFKIHDLRIVPGQSHTNVVFDCVVPKRSAWTKEEIKKRLTAAVQKMDPKFCCVITVEHEFVTESH